MFSYELIELFVLFCFEIQCTTKMLAVLGKWLDSRSFGFAHKGLPISEVLLSSHTILICSTTASTAKYFRIHNAFFLNKHTRGWFSESSKIWRNSFITSRKIACRTSTGAFLAVVDDLHGYLDVKEDRKFLW